MSIPGRKARSGGVRGLAVAGTALALLGSLAAAGEPPVARTPSQEALRELGRRLFFDPVASSRSGMRACADCHLPDHGFSDPERRSADDTSLTTRHSQTLVDAGDSPTAHWDGEFKTMRDLVVGRLNVTFDPDGSARYGSGSGDGQLLRGSITVFSIVEDVPDPSSDPLASLQADPHGDPAESLGAFGGGFLLATGDFDSVSPVPVGGVGESRSNGVDTPRPPGVADAFEDFVSLGGGFVSFGGGFSFAPARLSVGSEVLGGAAKEPFAPFLNAAFAPFLPPAATSLSGAGRYREGFLAAFAGAETPTDERIARAIEAYCHSIESGEAAYDRHVAGDETALSPAAKRGLALFRGKAGCASCHLFGRPRAPFSDYAFHNTGVEWRSNAALAPGTAVVFDEGRRARTGGLGEFAAFKTPTLRDVARRGPYMHDGSLATLEDVVRHYGVRPAARALDHAFPYFRPTDEDVADLVAFLRSLTSDVRPGLATSAWSARAARTRLRFVDPGGRPVAGLRVGVEPAGDVLPGSSASGRGPETLTTDPDGRLAFAPFATTHARLVLPEGVRPVGGDLVPDTCAAADVVVPVQGSARLRVVDPTGGTPPDVLVVRHPDAERFPGRRVPETRFVLRGSERVPDGARVSRYEGAFRTDVGGTALVEWPRADGAAVSTPVDFDPSRISILTLP